jgi:hypothetical protein
MKKILLIFCGIFIFSAAHVHAQKAGKPWNMDISAMPGSATNGGYGFVFGVDVRLQNEIADRLNFMLTTGISGLFKKQDVNGMSYIPVKAGLNYMTGENLYVGGELGVGFGGVKNSGRSFIWSPTVGLKFEHLDLSIKYEDAAGFKFGNNANAIHPEGSKNKYVKQFAVRVAYRFMLR